MKTKFKVGDKVKLKNSHFLGINSNNTGKVVCTHSYIYVLWSGDLKEHLGTYPHRVNEIKHVAIPGQQLLFAFMNED